MFMYHPWRKILAYQLEGIADTNIPLTLEEIYRIATCHAYNSYAVIVGGLDGVPPKDRRALLTRAFLQKRDIRGAFGGQIHHPPMDVFF